MEKRYRCFQQGDIFKAQGDCNLLYSGSISRVVVKFYVNLMVLSIICSHLPARVEGSSYQAQSQHFVAHEENLLKQTMLADLFNHKAAFRFWAL